METVIQHFSHEHHLKLCTAKKEGGVVCERCRLPILDQCAELLQDLVHPFHPQHCLKLHTKFPPNDDACRPSCNACGERCMGFTFYCSKSSCVFVMDINCVMLNIASPDHQCLRYSDQHIRHQHHLILCDNEKNSELFSSCCGRRDRKRSAYVCLQCSCLLHISCSELGKEIEHPFHPQHLLSLIRTSSANNGIRRVFFCNACGSRCIPITFCCSECLCLGQLLCFVDVDARQKHKRRRGWSSSSAQYNSTVYSPPSLNCLWLDKKTKFPRTCYACDLPFEEDSVVHVCLECGHLLHDSCPDLPQVISSPTPAHPPITLYSGPPHHVNLRSPFDFGPFTESCCRVFEASNTMEIQC
ncbi:hypothetical protein LOK49_LG13G01538 [Camellia lanceoleosa]|uniref:Uncharacterized protein n=1 Tax=Camellia lanceoleosa TaxID=1840588 RepID=A0ACC0FQ09_9ERIC|nr:hypothetical protein LOK49_LG13G01538 [Camellia lanceoleosa]